MNNVKQQIIDKIISLLTPLKIDYPNEIDIIINDLQSNKYDSLTKFVNNNFKDINISPIIKLFVNKLVDAKLIDKSFMDKIKDSLDYKFIPLKEKNIILVGSKPLNVKKKKLIRIKNNSPTPKLIKIEHEYSKVVFEEPKQVTNNIDELRKKIFDAQLNYLNDSTKFIKDLETKDEIELYDTLINLNDIRYIQHCLSKLSKSALYRLLAYVEEKYEKIKHSSIDMFIIEAIKKYLYKKVR